jgi:hypothetical protein
MSQIEYRRSADEKSRGATDRGVEIGQPVGYRRFGRERKSEIGSAAETNRTRANFC